MSLVPGVLGSVPRLGKGERGGDEEGQERGGGGVEVGCV